MKVSLDNIKPGDILWRTVFWEPDIDSYSCTKPIGPEEIKVDHVVFKDFPGGEKVAIITIDRGDDGKYSMTCYSYNYNTSGQGIKLYDTKESAEEGLLVELRRSVISLENSYRARVNSIKKKLKS